MDCIPGSPIWFAWSSRIVSSGSAPTAEEIAAGTQMFVEDPDSGAIMAEMERSPKLQRAAMDIAANGDAAKYEDDEEV